MIYVYKFWVEDIEEGVLEEEFEYNLKDYGSYDDMIEQVEQDRMEWVLDNVHSGYTETIKKK